MKTDNKISLVALIITFVIINGCNPARIALQGQYPNTPSEITSTKSVDSTWANLTGLFAANGLAIKKIDKTKGIVISSETAFIPVYTFENQDGQLINHKRGSCYQRR